MKLTASIEVYLGHIGQHVVTNSEGVPQYGDWLRHFWEVKMHLTLQTHG